MEQDRISNNFGCSPVSAVESKQDKNLLFENRISSLDVLLTTKETAEYLRTSPKQIRKWVYQGKIKAIKLCGKSLRFKFTEINLLLKGG